MKKRIFTEEEIKKNIDLYQINKYSVRSIAKIIKYTSMEDRTFKDYWALNNLRPLSAKQNVLDGTRRTRHVQQ